MLLLLLLPLLPLLSLRNASVCESVRSLAAEAAGVVFLPTSTPGIGGVWEYEEEDAATDDDDDDEEEEDEKEGEGEDDDDVAAVVSDGVFLACEMLLR